MAKAMQLEEKLRFLYDVVVILCVSCFLPSTCLQKQYF